MEEYVVNDNALYEFVVPDNTLYNNIQGDFAINSILYNDQSKLDIIRDFLNDSDQDKHEGGNIINYESAKYE
ncbi:16527_t:CDS:1, partial [Dentiscutata erythropus]